MVLGSSVGMDNTRRPPGLHLPDNQQIIEELKSRIQETKAVAEAEAAEAEAAALKEAAAAEEAEAGKAAEAAHKAAEAAKKAGTKFRAANAELAAFEIGGPIRELFLKQRELKERELNASRESIAAIIAARSAETEVEEKCTRADDALNNLGQIIEQGESFSITISNELLELRRLGKLLINAIKKVRKMDKLDKSEDVVDKELKRVAAEAAKNALQKFAAHVKGMN